MRNALKHFHAVRKDWRILGETAWRKESRDTSQRGFNRCVTGILWLVCTERYSSILSGIGDGRGRGPNCRRLKGFFIYNNKTNKQKLPHRGKTKLAALSCLRQQGTDIRTFAQRFSDAAEELGFNHAALKDMFNSVLDEPLNWWRMRGLDHLLFGVFVGFLARSPATEAGAPPVAVDDAAAPPLVVQELAVGQKAVPEPVPVQEPTEPAPVEAKEAAAPPAALDVFAVPCGFVT